MDLKGGRSGVGVSMRILIRRLKKQGKENT
jgi:hypothetical protein